MGRRTEGRPRQLLFVKDYKGINPNSDLEDFNPLFSRHISQHEGDPRLGRQSYAWIIRDHRTSGWYEKDSTGAIVSPYDWSDAAQLDFKNKEMWAGMFDAMKYW